RAAEVLELFAKQSDLWEPVTHCGRREDELAVEVADANHLAIFDLQTSQQHRGVIAWRTRGIQCQPEPIAQEAKEYLVQATGCRAVSRYVAVADFALADWRSKDHLADLTAQFAIGQIGRFVQSIEHPFAQSVER